MIRTDEDDDLPCVAAAFERATHELQMNQYDLIPWTAITAPRTAALNESEGNNGHRHHDGRR